MTRRKLSSDEIFKNALQRVRALDTRLNEVGEKLSADLAQAKSWLDSGSMSDEHFLRFCEYVTEFAARLPQTCGQRYSFDTAFIKSLAGDFGGRFPVTEIVIPRYGTSWGYKELQMARERNASDRHVVHLVYLAGEDRVEDINLLTYPWVAHEWGHYIMFRHGPSFSEDFQGRFGEITNSLRRSAIAHRGFVRAKSQEHIQELARFWTPTADHRNWAHELALDLLSVWTCGPAYLACFKDYLAHGQPDPYMIEPTHPPYCIRAEALIEAARQLGLEAYTTGLRRVVHSWDESKWAAKKDNHFIGLNNQEIVEACIAAAFTFCEFLNLAKCSADRVERVRAERGKSYVPCLGLDLLLKARAVFVDDGEETYDRWEEMTIDQLTKHLTL